MGTTLRGVTWDHTRGYTPVVATAQRFHELHPDVDVTWERRSLQEFADRPLDGLAERYDLLVVDHPWAGRARAGGALLDLAEHLPAGYLDDQARHSVGASYVSYVVDGAVTALPVDAAAPVAVHDAAWFAAEGREVPTTWDGVLALAREGLVAVATVPINLLMDFLAHAVTLGGTTFDGEHVVDRGHGATALDLVRELVSLCPPAVPGLDPIGVHEAIAAGDGPRYCPHAYGYANYSRPGYAPRVLDAGPPPSLDGTPLRTVLGGTGLAVSSRCRDVDAAVAYAAFTASPLVQRTLYPDAGGQPGHRGAWTDPEVNRRCRGALAATLPTLDAAYLRPRYDGYLALQDAAGDVVRDHVLHGGDPGPRLERLDALYRSSLAVGARS